MRVVHKSQSSDNTQAPYIYCTSEKYSDHRLYILYRLALEVSDWYWLFFICNIYKQAYVCFADRRAKNLPWKELKQRSVEYGAVLLPES